MQTVLESLHPQASRTRTFDAIWWVFVASLSAIILWLNALTMEQVWYVGLRQWSIWQTTTRLAGLPHLTSQHFSIYYPAGDRHAALMVQTMANRSWSTETSTLGILPRQRLVIVIYPSETTLNRAVHLPDQANNIGFEWNGVVDILTPSAWLAHSAQQSQTFMKVGPVPHELGHLLLNFKADGNYPAWFNEGVAQYEDWKVTGFQWLTVHNKLTGSLYPYSQLSTSFYQLPHQSLAYREAFSNVQYLIMHYGQHRFHHLLNMLGRGVPFNHALSLTYGHSGASLFSQWQSHLKSSAAH